MNPKLKELQERVIALKGQLEAPGADIAAISKSMADAQAEFNTLAEAEKTAQAVAKTLAEIAADNEPDHSGTHAAHTPAPVAKTGGVTTDLGNPAHLLKFQTDVIKAWAGGHNDKTPFSMGRLTDKHINAFNGMVLSEKQITLPKFMTDLMLGCDDTGRQFTKETSKQYRDTLREVTKALSTADTTGYSTDSGVGDMIPSNFFGELQEEPLNFCNLVEKSRRFPCTNGNITIPVVDYSAGPFGGVAVGTMATEITAPTATSPYFKTVTLNAKPHGALVQVSLRAIRNSGIDVVGMLTNYLRGAALYRMSKEFMAGTGESNLMAQGVVGATGVNVPVRVTVNQIVKTDLLSCIYAVNERLRTNAQFIIADAGIKYLEAIDRATADARPLFSEDPSKTMYPKLLGYAWESQNFDNLSNTSNLATLGTVGDCIFGNWQNYGYGVEQDITLTRSDDFAFSTGLATFRLELAFSGAPIHARAFATLKATTT